MAGQGAAASQPPFNILVDIKVVVATPSAARPPPCLLVAAATVAGPLLGRLQALAAHRPYRSQGSSPDCMVGYFQVFFVDTLCSGLGTFFIRHEGPKPRRSATPNPPLCGCGLRAKVPAGAEAGATLARGWRRLTQCPIGQNLNQRAPARRLPEVFGEIHIPLFFSPIFLHGARCARRGARDGVWPCRPLRGTEAARPRYRDTK